ncbi:RNA polymerase sigma-70 factor [Rapidithrix thailandica]|uniref:RNA polymerase sigma-70 factor n=1 Tax=Rapidithrix thailandica TaxID=413964 RepID=A0AAW9RUJ2_9BACT
MAKTEYIPTDEQALVDAICKGNRSAWEFMTKQYYEPLLYYILSMVKERESAEELIQDVLVNFWVKREQIEITSSLKAYLYRAARNHALNFIRRRNFELDYQKSLQHKLTLHHNDTEEQFHFSELEKKLTDAIENLPDNCREIFKLSRFNNLTYKEIADTLDLPVRTVHYQIGLALKELRQKLKGYVDQQLIS